MEVFKRCVAAALRGMVCGELGNARSRVDSMILEVFYNLNDSVIVPVSEAQQVTVSLLA